MDYMHWNIKEQWRAQRISDNSDYSSTVVGSDTWLSDVSIVQWKTALGIEVLQQRCKHGVLSGNNSFSVYSVQCRCRCHL